MASYGDYPDLRGVKKILVVKLRSLGDVLLTGPVFRSLQSFFPEAQIDACLYKEAIPILEGHPNVSHCFSVDPAWKTFSWWARLGQEVFLLWKIRKKKYDLVLNLTEGDRGILIQKVSGAKIRVGFRPKGFWQRKVLTHTVKSCPTPRHTVERNLDALRRIGLFPETEERELFFPISQEAKAKVAVWGQERSFILMHPASRWRFKCWPEKKMRELTERLLAEGWRVIFSSGPSSEEIESVQRTVSGLDVLNLAGKLSLQELGALIESSETLVCVDSLAFHIASALKKKVIALFGPTSDLTWGAWRNPRAKVLKSPLSCLPCGMDGCGGSKRSDCLESIPVNQVWEAMGFGKNSEREGFEPSIPL